MSALALRWRRLDPPIITRWRMPDRRAQPLKGLQPPHAVATIVGPPGPAGPAAAPVRFDVVSPAGTWILAHGLGRIPMVQVFIGDGEEVIADVESTTTQITVTHAAARAGFVLAF